MNLRSKEDGLSLVVQQLRIHLLMQGTWIRSLVWEDLTYHGISKPKGQNHWASVLEPRARTTGVHMSTEPTFWNKGSQPNEEPMSHNQRGPYSPELRTACAAAETQSHQKKSEQVCLLMRCKKGYTQMSSSTCEWSPYTCTVYGLHDTEYLEHHFAVFK